MTISSKWHKAIDLLASMRFAIGILVVIAAAASIGSVIPQRMPYAEYLERYGLFWAEKIVALQLNAVYSAWWFMLLLGFLLASTSLCLARNTPPIWASLRNQQRSMQVDGLAAMPYQAQLPVKDLLHSEQQMLAIIQLLQQRGWKVRHQQPTSHAHEQIGKTASSKVNPLHSARQGGLGKLGYVAAHAAIVLICLGALLDSDLWVRIQVWAQWKTPSSRPELLTAPHQQETLSCSTPSFRGNLLLAEGNTGHRAILNMADGFLVQPLPFDIELHRFTVERYATGMPKTFASDIAIRDHATGKVTQHQLSVNHPVRLNGMELYQSGFDDGGSQVSLKSIRFWQTLQNSHISGRIGQTLPLDELATTTAQPELAGLTLELLELQTLNIEERNAVSLQTTQTVAHKPQSLNQYLGASQAETDAGTLIDMGPSIRYRLRDTAGQALDFHNYMQANDLGDGLPVYLLGVRRPDETMFRYLRIPQDSTGTMSGFLRLQQALRNEKLLEQAIENAVQSSDMAESAEAKLLLHQLSTELLMLFTGQSPRSADDSRYFAGLEAVMAFIEDEIPAAKQSSATASSARILNSVLDELQKLSQPEDNHAESVNDETSRKVFTTLSLKALSDTFYYPVPIFFELDSYRQINASVIQVNKSPGRPLVYLGCLFLVGGIFAMLYIRERRLWIWFEDTKAPSVNHIRIAMSSNRRTQDCQAVFDSIVEQARKITRS